MEQKDSCRYSLSKKECMEQKIIVVPEGKIYDYIDKKFRNDTPEEYVRQTIEKQLVNEHKYLFSHPASIWKRNT
jgi:hypothetical protein